MHGYRGATCSGCRRCRVSEIDHLFGYGHFAKPGRLILLMHDEMFQDAFDGKAKLTAPIAALRMSHSAFGAIATYD